jgi:hypothetical protein
MLWKDDASLKRIHVESKSKIEGFFLAIGDKATTAGYIQLNLMIDRKTIDRVLLAMLSHGWLEKIEATSGTVYYRIKR